MLVMERVFPRHFRKILGPYEHFLGELPPRERAESINRN